MSTALSHRQLKQMVRSLIDSDPQLKRNIKSVAIFGSYLHGEQHADSDLDILVEFNETPGLIEFIRIQHFFEDNLHIRVDLCTPEMLSKYFRDDVLTEAETVYG